MGIQQKIDRKLKEIDDLFDDDEIELPSIAWQPYKGKPQELAYYSPADDLLYGGEPGGGKSDLIAGLALTAHRRSLILRREASQLNEMIARIEGELLDNQYRFHGKTNILKYGDRWVEKGGCKLEKEKVKYKGRAHDLKCVGKGTLVWMADGTKKPIEQILIGDYVYTLEGARKVTRVIQQTKPAVLFQAFQNGVKVGEQVQGLTHELMTEHKQWVSHDKLGEGSRDRDALFLPKQYCYERKSFLLLLPRFLSVWRLLDNSQLDLLQVQEQFQDLLAYQKKLGLLSCKASTDLDNCFLEIGDVLPFFEPPLLSSLLLLKLFSRPFHQLACDYAQRLVFHEAIGVLFESLLQDSMDHYLRGSHLCDGLSRLWQEVVLLSPLLQGDAGPQIPNDLLEGDEGIVPKHSRCMWSYVHPYTMEKRQTVHPLSACHGFSVELPALTLLYDLTVDELNHFITECGFINRNCFDELSEFPKSIYDYVKTWNRTSVVGQRCRTVATTNPPDTQEGQWIISSWAPWLDKRHPNPAQSGEIRWYLGDKEVDEGTPDARSRTFIYSSIDDNPILLLTGYKSTLNSLPEELRKTMMEGFTSGMQDTPYQVIPTSWVQDAINRGKLLEQKTLLEPIDAIACDPSRGGKDSCAIAIRRGYNIQTREYPAITAQDGMQVVQYIINAMQGQKCIIQIDIGGIGASPVDIAKLQGLEPIAMDAGAKSHKRDRSAKLSFANKRAEWWWKFREALDPNYSPQITLPDDPKLIAELTSPCWSLTMRGILIESKDEIKKRLGRSTNLADAIVMVVDVPQIYTSSFI